LVILLLIVANGFFSGAEIAILSVRKTRLQQMVDDGSRGASAVMNLRNRPEQFLATVQVALTLVGTGAAAFGGHTLSAQLVPSLQKFPSLAPYAEDLSLAIVIGAVSYAELVLGELVPKSLALRAGETYATLVGRPLLGLSYVAKPLVWILTHTSNLILKPFGDGTTFTEARLSPEELQQLVEEASKTGTLDARSGEIASRALEFAGLTVADVMVPRNRIAAISRDSTPEQVRTILLERGRTRMPVYEGTLDNIVGYITIKDVLKLAWNAQSAKLADLLRPAYFVPMTMQASQLLRELQKRRLRLALVVDEHGGTEGLVTLEALVEELVGQLFNEGEQSKELIQKQPDGSALVDGETPLREVNRALALDLQEGENWTTLAGLCIQIANGIPSKGTKLEFDGTGLEIVEATPRAVRLVKVTRPPPPPSTEEQPVEKT
jgi:putative hemolysin